MSDTLAHTVTNAMRLAVAMSASVAGTMATAITAAIATAVAATVSAAVAAAVTATVSATVTAAIAAAVSATVAFGMHLTRHHGNGRSDTNPKHRKGDGRGFQDRFRCVFHLSAFPLFPGFDTIIRITWAKL
ncbi:hypothetical protein [Marimonas lutisalis]|uniref:hypothetical protein n=1 Tax=Marimonas lutisalis TaxID=2545756 RepID=UPI001375C3F0|nr:hypothetical protein [Marimonas lutisalis]